MVWILDAEQVYARCVIKGIQFAVAALGLVAWQYWTGMSLTSRVTFGKVVLIENTLGG